MSVFGQRASNGRGSSGTNARSLLGEIAFCVGTLVACTGEVPPSRVVPAGTGAAPSMAGAAGNGAAGVPGGGVGGAAGSATAGSGPQAGTGGTPGGGSGGTPSACADPAAITPGRAPVRRLTKFEYNNTVRDLLGDTTNPGLEFPSELIGNGFGNDADAQPVSSLLAAEYDKAAEAVAVRATSTVEGLAKLSPCASSVTEATEASCARTIIESFVPRAYRRPLSASEVEEFLALFTEARQDSSFATAIASVIHATLQAPEFLYRVEFGELDAVNPALRRPTGHELATRLSYLFWGTTPDAQLLAAAAGGALATKEGVLAEATRLLDDPSGRSRGVVRFFFDNLLPITNITDVARDAVQYPTFSPQIAALMQQETRTFIEQEVFAGPGTWPGMLTAPYTYVNQTLATYYGMTGVTGDAFQKVDLDTTQRLGLLTQGALMVGSTPTNFTNPVLRGVFVVRQLMCRHIEPPTDPEILSQVTPPDPYSGATARDRFTQHSQQPVCAGCHAEMDPMGLPLENFDAVGLYRTTENGVVIDASGEIPGMVDGAVAGPVEMARKLAANDEVQHCFSYQWSNFAYGRTLDDADACLKERVYTAFRDSGFNVKALMLALAQSDAFLYLPAVQE